MNALQKFIYGLDKQFHIAVGLDSDINKIPEHLKKEKDPVYEFNKIIIENTKDLACSYKVNLAFYESDGIEGLKSLEKTLELIPEDVLTIGDAKRGDIGNTSKMYARSIFDHFKFDSITLHPYMGSDSVSPFVEYNDKLNFILALTSNKGSADFEKLALEDGTFLYQKVIKTVHDWNEHKNCGIVFGATNPEELKTNMEIIGNLPVLLPGVGAQGGSLEDVVETFKTAGSRNFIINVSRGLIYADSSENFGAVTRAELEKYNKKIGEILGK
ncbi:MAG: orotidine-5'-phosphate decarboxylase [Rhodothermaceae bacterium]